jgi:hypothetical protein
MVVYSQHDNNKLKKFISQYFFCLNLKFSLARNVYIFILSTIYGIFFVSLSSSCIFLFLLRVGVKIHFLSCEKFYVCVRNFKIIFLISLFLLTVRFGICSVAVKEEESKRMNEEGKDGDNKKSSL